MKKLLIIIGILLFSVSLKAQENVKLVIPDSTKLTVGKVYNDVKSGLEGLAKGLKTGVEHVYIVLVKQQVAISITNIVIYLFLIILLVISVKTAKSTYAAHLEIGMEKDNEGKPRYTKNSVDIYDTAKGPLSVALAVLSIILSIFLIVFVCSTLNETIAGLVNPEYGAIKEIINFVK